LSQIFNTKIWLTDMVRSWHSPDEAATNP